MAGDHKCPVCSSTFTRPQHVARHMRSHTGDRPYECTHCGDRFARSDLLSRHVNKCHASEKPPTTTQPARRKGHAQPGSSAAAGVSGPAPSLIPPPGTRKVCDACASSRTPAQCDAGLPCGKCLQRSTKCTYIKALETIRRPQAFQGISLSKPTDLIAPPMTVPSMGLPQRNDPTLFPSHSNFNFSVPLHTNLSTQAITSQSPYFASSAGNQGSTPQPTQARGQLPVPAPYPAFMSADHHQQQQAPSTMFGAYPAPHTATRAKNELDAYLLENAFGGSNSIEGAGTTSSSYLYNNTHAQELMAQSQHQSGLPHIDHHHIGYPGYTPPSTARPVSSHSSQHSHSTQPSPQQRHQSVFTNTSDTQTGNDSPSYASPSSASIQNNNALPPPSHTQPADGGISVSSAFGKMSIDDPVVAAEMNKSSSFFAPQAFPKTSNHFANSTVSAASGSGLTPFLGPSYKWFSPSFNSSAGLLTPGLGLGSTLGLGNLSNSAYNLQTSGSGLTPFLGPDALNSHVNFDPNTTNTNGTGYTPGKESNIAELKEFWKQFMKTPGEKTPGLGAFGHGLHADGSHTDTETSRPRHSMVKMASYPDLKTPGGSNLSNNGQPFGPGVHGFDREDLRSYEQAVLARKAPQLTLVPRRRGTLPQTHGDIQAKRGVDSNENDTLKLNSPFQRVADSPSPSVSSSTSVSDPGSLRVQTQKVARERPTFKRLASQTLGPFESKSVKTSHRDMNLSEVKAEETDGDDDPEWSNMHDPTVGANTFQHLRPQPQSCGQTTHDPTRRLNVSEAIAQG